MKVLANQNSSAIFFFTQNSHYLVVQKLFFHFHLVQHEDPTRNKSVLKQQYHTTYTTEKV